MKSRKKSEKPDLKTVSIHTTPEAFKQFKRIALERDMRIGKLFEHVVAQMDTAGNLRTDAR